MHTWKEKINKLNFLVLCLLSCFPLLGMKITVILIIAFTIVSVVPGLIYGREKIDSTAIREFLLLISLFALIFIRTYVTDRSPNSLFYLEVSLSLFVFPSAFFFITGYLFKRPEGYADSPFFIRYIWNSTVRPI